ncbi:type-4 uracil-DNA glycosylase [Pyrobaculum aerophilum]|uniref:Type-4 uracil-DNA glycosylase n=2 Tax=Pyrobaculum aerophilum TaxID=13773 RepID=UDGA_PYRAE|nr:MULTISPECIES: type-4 uracil-DNA glycosylase [Pyrobaculum]Q8ZYS2.1 RecName: Full=Type-4 uracil-DNA glycosylase; AltName: Full=Pa-UDG; AltName: Full=Pa-UDGa [Pyrobaculum aerophilum str. IM2]AAL62921.1 uracil DNA glycosylase (Pa-UDGa) [Pyrobaculum aerophilum str. IM2]MCX8135880.1 type-4 uracil-DNA glycosylase [Pyrobaculum aerophilum]HII46057.1 uracil-DNA glycosylase [Pyrobaculum aerophilum]
MDLQKLHELIKNCDKCPLHKYRKNAVPGEGEMKLGVMIVGEAPGASEDEAGRPFVGAAGQLLTEALSRLGVRRGDVFITNVVKCRPPNNRTPNREEVEACLPYLIQQIGILKPRRIIALGLISAKALMELMGRRAEKLGDVKGKCYQGRIAGVQVELCITYHPAAVLRKPALRGEFQKDLAMFFGGGLDRFLDPSK